MRFLALLFAVQNPTDKKIYILTRYYELSSIGFFSRNQAKETFKFVIRNSFPGLEKGSRNQVSHEEYNCFFMKDQKQEIAAYAFCDQDYPRRVIFQCLKQNIDEFTREMDGKWQVLQKDENVNVNSIYKLFTDYQNPAVVDQVFKAQQQVEEIEVIMYQNLQKLLERQGDLDELVAKSEDLSKGAKMFYKQSKSLNKGCCAIF